MAQVQVSQMGDEETNLASAANWFGAAISLALLVGLAYWGYQLIMRDVSGVPVVRAIEGPMRVAPEDPGGQVTPHKGLAVNDVAGSGATAPFPEQLTLAPPPVALTEEDQPKPALVSVQAESLVPEAVTEDTVADTAIDLEAVRAAEDPVEALANMIAAQAKPFEVMDAPVPETEPGVSQSLRPLPRPAELIRATALAAPVRQQPSRVVEIAPADIPSGTRLVQFGAFDSVETARARWDLLSAQYGEFMNGKARVIEQASAGGSSFYRLRAHGFADLGESRRFCAALADAPSDCIPVLSR